MNRIGIRLSLLAGFGLGVAFPSVSALATGQEFDLGSATSITISDLDFQYDPSNSVDGIGNAVGRTWAATVSFLSGTPSLNSDLFEQIDSPCSFVFLSSFSGDIHDSISYADGTAEGLLDCVSLVGTAGSLSNELLESGQQAFGSTSQLAYSSALANFKWSVDVDEATDLSLSFHVKFWYGIANESAQSGTKIQEPPRRSPLRPTCFSATHSTARRSWCGESSRTARLRSRA
ncbi:MAG: hypothetical protein H6814_11345 [Phycisphaeraceae bacterium]|nr:hypothetical protein [Phycisphaeraceae bacterium]